MVIAGVQNTVESQEYEDKIVEFGFSSSDRTLFCVMINWFSALNRARILHKHRERGATLLHPRSSSPSYVTFLFLLLLRHINTGHRIAPYFPITHFNIIQLPTPGLPKWSFLSGSPKTRWKPWIIVLDASRLCCQYNRHATDSMRYIKQQYTTILFLVMVSQSEQDEQCTKTGPRLPRTMQTLLAAPSSRCTPDVPNLQPHYKTSRRKIRMGCKCRFQHSV